MSKVSQDFGRLISSFLESNKLSFRSAALQSEISAAYWKDMSDGRVPSEDILERISKSFDGLDENELRVSAGYSPKNENMDAIKAVELAMRGQNWIPEDGVRQILDFVKEMQDKYSQK